ncbi:MAG: alpha/beta hydrolase [Homoserinimonas sp.]|jgi:pimeloyl-ACP methyl ester carboxylesterase|nr:alpha/beta hydrolase [Homoserinimonas sp.]
MSLSSPRTFETDGLVCHVFATPAAGPRDDLPTFVLLHGIGMTHRYLERLHTTLAAVGNVYSFDLPGFGSTPKPQAAVSVETYAELIGAFLDSEQVDSCVLVGHSMGVQFAIEVARQRPDAVTHVVLMGPVVDAARRSIFQQALALGRDSLREPPSANLIVFTDYIRCGPRWYLTELPVMMDYPTEERIADLTCPALVIRGADDPVAKREWSASLAGRARSGQFAEFRGRHVVQMSSAQDVASAIVSFVSGRARMEETSG